MNGLDYSAGLQQFDCEFDKLQTVNDVTDACADIRVTNADFQVTEELGFTLSGEGEHLWLLIEKDNLNTQDVVTILARQSGVKPRDIGFSGQKDRNAITRQWISLPWTLVQHKDIEGWLLPEDGTIRILDHLFHQRKLKIGSHKSNSFSITLRNIKGDRQGYEARLASIKENGVPAYFGPQRFGRNGKNLSSAYRLFSGQWQPRKHQRNQKSMALSAARSWLFNQVLSRRVKLGNWNTAIEGDVLQMEGKGSFFSYSANDDSVGKRLADKDIHPSGPLWGKGELPSSGLANELEWAIAQDHPEIIAGLENSGLKQSRRALRQIPHEFSWQWIDELTLGVQFSLVRGQFATSVLREISNINN